MRDTNGELRTIMQDHDLGITDIARQLNVAEATVLAWTMANTSSAEIMPESELRPLQYALMTDNKRYHLF
ncbi:MAG: hypothetical protein WBG92_09115 [Thiohalocapsa sp.]